MPPLSRHPAFWSKESPARLLDEAQILTGGCSGLEPSGFIPFSR